MHKYTEFSCWKPCGKCGKAHGIVEKHMFFTIRRHGLTIYSVHRMQRGSLIWQSFWEQWLVLFGTKCKSLCFGIVKIYLKWKSVEKFQLSLFLIYIKKSICVNSFLFIHSKAADKYNCRSGKHRGYKQFKRISVHRQGKMIQQFAKIMRGDQINSWKSSFPIYYII